MNSSPKYDEQRLNYLYKVLKLISRGAILLIFLILGILIYLPNKTSILNALESDHIPIMEPVKGAIYLDPERVEKGIHVASGMIYDKDFRLVKNACTSCHSAKLITQNRATKEGWQEMITWMQKTQGLPDLGEKEVVIIDYLARNYAPEKIDRRQFLNKDEIEWFVLNLDKE